MSDLIERDKVIEYCLKLIDVERKQGSDVMNYGQERINQTDTIIAFVENLPSARHREGKWLGAGRMTQFNQFYYFRYCSECFYARDDCDSEKDTNFCPNCGARMKGADDE